MELWAAIPGYEGIYEASTEGRIRRILSIPNCRRVPYTLKPQNGSNGYTICALSKDRIQRSKSIHRLVMAAFHGPSEREVNHLNGNKRDNRLANLEYVTPKQNCEHAVKTGLMPSGERKIRSAKLTAADVRKIRAARAVGLSAAELAACFRVHEQNIYQILARKTWKQVP